MSNNLLQTTPFGIGRYSYYRLGSTTLNQLKKAKIIIRIAKPLSDKKPDWFIIISSGVVKTAIEYNTSEELSTKAKIDKAINEKEYMEVFVTYLHKNVKICLKNSTFCV